MSSKVTDDPSPALGRRRQPAEPGGWLALAPHESAVRHLYTVSMMAAVLDVPEPAVRHWVRTGLLQPAQRQGTLDWFDFPQLVVGRGLARLLVAGLSLREIDARLATLTPGGAQEAALACERIVADGRRLSIRRDGRLLGANGQLQFGFYTAALDDDVPALVIRAPAIEPVDAAPAVDGVGELLDLAADLAAGGQFAEAAEALRAVLQASGPTAEVTFMLAEVLYRSGDLTAARERYYAAIELDADHLEARANLGCVLAELGDHELALAALEGVLRQQPDYADAHWHLGGILDGVGRRAEAERHYESFVSLAPDSPWAAHARGRLDCDESPH